MGFNAAYNALDPLKDIHYYQGVLLVEVALTLLIFFILRCVHYIKWGYDDENGGAPEAEGEERPKSEKKEEKK